MNIDEAQKILATVKKRKLAKGIDLTVAVRGVEALLMIMFQLVILLFVLTTTPLRNFPFVLFPVIAVILGLIIACIPLLKKVTAVQEFMLMKRIYSLNEIEK